MGRYVLTPRYSRSIERVGARRRRRDPTDRRDGAAARREPVCGYWSHRRSLRHRASARLAEGTVELAAERDDLGPGFREYLAELRLDQRRGGSGVPLIPRRRRDGRSYSVAACVGPPEGDAPDRRAGHVMAEEVRRSENVPPVRQLRDGRLRGAVRSDTVRSVRRDRPVRLEVVGPLAAGVPRGDRSVAARARPCGS